MANLQNQQRDQGESVQVLQEQLDHEQLAPNQNQILPDQSHHNPLREKAAQQGEEQNPQSPLAQQAPLDEGDLRDVALDERKLDPQERPPSDARYAPGREQTHASPEQQEQDFRNLEKHTSNEQVEQANKMEQADKNPQVPGNQQHQSPGSPPLNNVKQQQGIDTLIDNT